MNESDEELNLESKRRVYKPRRRGGIFGEKLMTIETVRWVNTTIQPFKWSAIYRKYGQ